jgi:phosphatidylinositol glycan class V
MKFSVALFSIFTRTIIFTIAILTQFIAIDYDVSTLLEANSCTGKLDLAIQRITKPFVRWDAVYFLDIARNGYSSEQQFAFFPGYPILIRVCAKLLAFMGELLSLKLCESLYFTISGLIISNVSFVLAAVALYE